MTSVSNTPAGMLRKGSSGAIDTVEKSQIFFVRKAIERLAGLGIDSPNLLVRGDGDGILEGRGKGYATKTWGENVFVKLTNGDQVAYTIQRKTIVLDDHTEPSVTYNYLKKFSYSMDGFGTLSVIPQGGAVLKGKGDRGYSSLHPFTKGSLLGLRPVTVNDRKEQEVFRPLSVEFVPNAGDLGTKSFEIENKKLALDLFREIVTKISQIEGAVPLRRNQQCVTPTQDNGHEVSIELGDKDRERKRLVHLATAL